MSELTDNQIRLVRGVALVVGLLAIVLAVLSLAGVGTLPFYIPLMLLLVAVGLFIGGQRNKKASPD